MHHLYLPILFWSINLAQLHWSYNRPTFSFKTFAPYRHFERSEESCHPEYNEGDKIGESPNINFYLGCSTDLKSRLIGW